MDAVLWPYDKCMKCARKKYCEDSMQSIINCLENSFRDFQEMTNADKIRKMTDEELADFLWSIGSSPFSGNVYLGGKYLFFTGDGNGWLDWLKQEVEGDA